jgi:cellulose synthase/poly-beta-1,6-N-acetylglucosamine synthase-like glycosyltransferase
MTIAIEILLAFLGALLVVPAAVLFVECVAALLPERPPEPDEAASPERRVVVLIPAYDEGRVLKRTIDGVTPELGPHDRILVIADNCTDGTADIARAAGAEVLERRDPEHRGKGYALDAGVAHLSADPPDVVVILDADCNILAGSIKRLADCAASHGRPAQAEDLLTVPDRATPLARVSALAFLVRNHVRPTGLRRLGMPCHLMGTGMAFPWDVISSAPSAGPHLAEDMQMGIALASLGYAPVYCTGARITSASPKLARAVRGERRRWEHGHIETLIHRAPTLIWKGLARRQLPLLTMGLDLLIPPLALLVTFMFAGVALASLLAALGGSPLPLTLFSTSAALVLVAVLSAWAKFGRATFPARYLVMIPLYVVWKIPLYLSFAFRGPYATWERAERSASGF